MGLITARRFCVPLRRLDRQPHHHPGAAPFGLFEDDLAAVIFEYALDDGETKARAFDLRGKKRLKDALAVLFRYAGARVLDPDLHPRAFIDRRGYPERASSNHGL